MNNTKIFKYSFPKIYQLLINKVEKKGRKKEELDSVIFWLTGNDETSLKKQLEKDIDYETFFDEAPSINPNANKITGMICGYRIEEIENELMRKIRYLDKLVDELAKGKPMDKIFRK